MAIAIEPGRVIDYILVRDRKLPKEQQSIFKVKTLTDKELAQIEDSYSSINPITAKFDLKTGSRTLSILRMGLTGWENFKDKHGKPVLFNKDDPDFSYLLPEYRREIANFITEQTNLDEGEIKN